MKKFWVSEVSENFGLAVYIDIQHICDIAILANCLSVLENL